MNADDPGEQESALVMPFVAVASKGGPFADDAYTAGYEMGLLDAALDSLDAPGFVQRTLRVENQAQADLLAVRHGWRSSFTELGDGWIGAEFARAAGEDPS